MELTVRMLKKGISFDFTDLPIFKGFSDEEISTVINDFHGLIKFYPKGDYVYLAGDIIENICVVMNGSVQMIKEDVLGEKTIIANLSEGDIFAGTNLGSVNKRSLANYISSSDSELLLLPVEKILYSTEKIVPYKIKLMRNVLGLLADINTKLIRKSEILSRKTLRGKITSYLQFEAEESGAEQFEIPFNRTDLANYLDADRSALTRELSRMQAEGLLEYNKNTFKLIKGMTK